MITLTELKKELKGLEKDVLIKMICEMYKKDDLCKQYLSVKFQNECDTELLKEYKKKMRDIFFPKNYMRDVSLMKAKKLISNFKKISSDTYNILDLMLYYVELGNEYTNKFGDMYESFYDSIISMFEKFVDNINKADDEKLYNFFRVRVDELLKNSQDIGWGYSDCIEELYNQIIWK